MSSGSSGPHNGESVVICEASVVLPHQTLSSEGREEENSKMTSLSSAFAGRSLFGSSAPPPPTESPAKDPSKSPEKTPVKTNSPVESKTPTQSEPMDMSNKESPAAKTAEKAEQVVENAKADPPQDQQSTPAPSESSTSIAETSTTIPEESKSEEKLTKEAKPQESKMEEPQVVETESPEEQEAESKEEEQVQEEEEKLNVETKETEKSEETAEDKKDEEKNEKEDEETDAKMVTEESEKEDKKNVQENMEQEKMEEVEIEEEEEEDSAAENDPAPEEAENTNDERKETAESPSKMEEEGPEGEEEKDEDAANADQELSMEQEMETEKIEEAGSGEESETAPPPQKKKKMSRKEMARKLAEGRRKKREQEKQEDSSEGEENQKEDPNDSALTRRSLRARNTAVQEKTTPGSTRKSRNSTTKEDARRSSRVRTPARTETPKTRAETPPTRGRRARNAEAPGSAPGPERVSRQQETPVQQEKKPKAATVGPAEKKRGRKRGGAKKMDPYDLESNIDASPEPLKHISMERSSFGELRFTTPQSAIRPRFSFTAKAAGKRQSGPSSSQESLPSGRRTSEKVTSSISHELKRQMSPKESPSTGELGDISSAELRRSSSGSLARSSGSSRGATLFRDIENRMEDGEENEVENGDSAYEEEEEGTRKSHKKGASRAGTSRTPTKSNATPEPKKGRQPSPVPTLSAAEQLRVDFPPDSHSQLEPGARVMAKWLDKCHYPGVVMRNVGFGRYKIRFITDGNTRDMPGPDLVLFSRLEVGKTLMIATEDVNEDELLEPVEIVKTPNSSDADNWVEGYFEVQNIARDENQRIHWLDFVIDKDQRSGFVDNVVNKAAQDVVSDNISEGRARRSRPSTFSPAPAPATPQSETPGKRKPKTPSQTPSTPTSGKRGRKPKAKEQQKQSPASQESKKPRKIFKDFKFVLTSANRRPKPGETAENEDERPPVVFNKRQVRQAIEERGGTVIEDFAHTQKAEGVFLVADTHYRTHKYLSALARAVPCVSHMWILDSCAENTALDFAAYILPSGISLSSRVLIEWHADAPTLLSGLRVMVHTENRNNPGSLDFVQIWAPLVRCMGAEVLETLPKDKNLDILLTDASCPDSLLNAAKEQGADTISSEWLIQAIITGERPAADAHEKFRYDYVEQVGGAES